MLQQTRGDIELNLPDAREYAEQADADLDAALVDAIEAAEEAGNEYLATVLRNELGSHYYETR
jgi:hypothetical protein